MIFKKIVWTNHSEEKMRFYSISKQRIRRILNSPQRIETGIAEKTLACMQNTGGKIKHELWVMYQDNKNERRIISAWKYPGKTKPGELIIPENAL